MSTTTHESVTRQDGLATPQWLEDHLDDPAVRVVEVDVGPAAYDDGHIPGAVLRHVYRDLKDASYRLRGPAEIEQLVTRSEIVTCCTIGARACTAWFALTPLLGREHVRVYDGSWADWGHARSTPVERA